MFNLKTKVLIVDDMLTMRKIVSKVLKEIGFSDITEACDGKDAWQKVITAPEPFGLIISDWNMPNMTGLDFLKQVRADQKFSKTPFLLVTAEAEQHQVAEAIKSGVDQYVIKPFSQDNLKTKLEMAHKKVSARISA
jgi:two-component system, chemotaxis family, chemotaxis protein CheY